MTKTDALRRLQGQVDLIDSMKQQKRFSPEFRKWHRDTEIVVERIFGKDTRHGKDFTRVHYNLGAFNSVEA